MVVWLSALGSFLLIGLVGSLVVAGRAAKRRAEAALHGEAVRKASLAKVAWRHAERPVMSGSGYVLASRRRLAVSLFTGATASLPLDDLQVETVRNFGRSWILLRSPHHERPLAFSVPGSGALESWRTFLGENAGGRAS